MKINYIPTFTNGIYQSSFKKNQIDSFSTPQPSNSSNYSKEAFSVTVSNEAKIKSSHNHIMSSHFPPDYAPDGVKKAWQSVTSKLPPEVAAIVTRGPFMAAEISANLKFNSNGEPVGFYRKGEEGHVDIYSQPGFTYGGLIDQMLGNIEKGSGPNKYYQATKQFLNELDQSFTANGIV